MEIKIVTETITIEELRKLAETFYITMIKGVVDIHKEIVAFGGEYHIDANNVLIDDGSNQSDIWGFNVVFDEPKESWIEYISLINIRPKAKNFDMEVQDASIRDTMKKIINSKIA